VQAFKLRRQKGSLFFLHEHAAVEWSKWWFL
jgi:hypothetical protein